jgi:hypothetical protein
MTGIYNMTPAQYAAWWQRIRDKRKDDLQATYACPECGKLFAYRKWCANHCRDCAGGKPVPIDAPCVME